eukprot:g4677.t1
MLAEDAAHPAVETALARSDDGAEGSSGESGGGGGNTPGSNSGEGSNTGGSSPLAARASTPLTSPRPAAVDRQESRSVLSFSRLSSWRSWGGVGGFGDAIPEEESEAVTAAAEHGPSYHCQICLNDRPAEAGFPLSACGHTFCRGCLKAYVTSKVNDAEVYPTCFHVAEEFDSVGGGGGDGRAGQSDDDDDCDDDDCDAAVAAENGRARDTAGSDLGATREAPGTGKDGRGRDGGDGRVQKRGSCGVVLSPSDIEELLRADAVTSQKYARFLFFRKHKTARECPKCGKLSVGNPSVSWEMRCGGCGAVFCYEHGGAHEGKSCAEYLESTADDTQRSMALIGRMTKPCPGCGTPVEKLGGCNQMVCLHCNCSFCWICMEQVDRGTFPVHFQWWNVRGCPNQQLQEDAHQSTGGRQCLKALSVLQIVVVGPFALLLTVASSLACFCCLPAFKLSPRQLFTGCISGWGNFIMVLPLIPLLCASAVVAGVVYIVMLPVRISTAMHRKWRYGGSGLSLPGPRRRGGVGRSGSSNSSNSSSSSSISSSSSSISSSSISSSASSSSSRSDGGASSGGRQGQAEGAGWTASSPANRAIGAADVDVKTSVGTSPNPAAAVLSEVVGSRQERGAEALPSPLSPVMRSISQLPPVAPLSSAVADMPGPLAKSGEGGSGDSTAHPAAPSFSPLGVRHMLGRWLGASPSPSPAAAVGAAVSGAASAAAAAAASEAVAPPRRRRSFRGPADGEAGAIGHVSGYPTTGGVAFIGTAVFSPLSLLSGDEGAPRATLAGGTNGSLRDELV